MFRDMKHDMGPRKKYLIYMKGRSVRWWWDGKIENFPLEVALDKWPSKTYAMCILQGLREISAEKLEWDFRKEESLCKVATLSSQSSRIDIPGGGAANTSWGWIMFTKHWSRGGPGARRGRHSTGGRWPRHWRPRHGAFLNIRCVAILRGISPVIRPKSPGLILHDYTLRTPGPGQRKDVCLV